MQELTDSDLIHYFCVATLVHKLFGFFVLPLSEVKDYKKTAMIDRDERSSHDALLTIKLPECNASVLEEKLVEDELVFFSDLSFFFSMFSGQATWCVFSFRESASHFPTALSLHEIWHGISAE